MPMRKGPDLLLVTFLGSQRVQLSVALESHATC